MNKLIINFFLLVTASSAYAMPLPVNGSNLKCVIEEYSNYDGENRPLRKVYWGFAVYQNKYKQFLKGSYDDSSPVREACKTVKDIIAESDNHGGYLEIPTSRKTYKSDCIVELSGGQWGGRPTGVVYYSVKEVESLIFPFDLALSDNKYYTERYVGTCPN